MNRAVRRQGGYTLVETIVAIAVGAIVMTAIFPVFLLLYRIETTWGNATQARASGLLAEESLLRDLRAYHVDELAPPPLPDRTDSLVLSGLTIGTQTYRIEYYIEKSTSPGRTSSLIRLVSKDGHAISKGTVAHGIEQLTATCAPDRRSIQLEILTTGTAGRPVQLAPVLVVTPRNAQACR